MLRAALSYVGDRTKAALVDELMGGQFVPKQFGIMAGISELFVALCQPR
jgi:hypothetical protein